MSLETQKHRVICILCVLRNNFITGNTLHLNTSKFMRKLYFFCWRKCWRTDFLDKVSIPNWTLHCAIYKKNTSHWDWRHLITKTWKSNFETTDATGFHTFILIRRLMAFHQKCHSQLHHFATRKGRFCGQHLCIRKDKKW